MLRVNATLGSRLRLALCWQRNGTNSSSSASPALGLVGPAARFLLLEYQLDASKVHATGPRNALLKQDVLDYVRTHDIKKGSVPTPTGTEPRKSQFVGSRRLSRSFVDVPLLPPDLISKTTVPHGYLSTHADVTEIVNQMRKLSAEGCELCLTTVVIRACVLALKVVPELNAASDAGRTSLQPVVNIAMYVPSQGKNSVFGVLRGTEKMTMREIEVNRRTIEKKVAAGTLTAEDAEGGTFSICNLSDLSVSDSAELVRPHQLATLTIGRLHHFVSEEQSEADRSTRRSGSEYEAAYCRSCYSSREKALALMCAEGGNAFVNWQNMVTSSCPHCSRKEKTGKSDASMTRRACRGKCMSKELRHQVIQLYKQLMYMARDYPAGEDYFKSKLRRAFRGKKEITDEKLISQALKHGEFVKKELEALYYLRKYRAMKKRYYDDS